MIIIPLPKYVYGEATLQNEFHGFKTREHHFFYKGNIMNL